MSLCLQEVISAKTIVAFYNRSSKATRKLKSCNYCYACFIYTTTIKTFNFWMVWWKNLLKSCSFYRKLLESLHRKTPCKYGPIFALYLYRIESSRVNTLQKRVRIYTAFFLCYYQTKSGKRVSYSKVIPLLNAIFLSSARM